MAVGDHVVISTLSNCGACAACDSGRPTHCRESIGKMSAPFRQGDRKVLQFANIGAFSEQTVVKARQAVPINKDVPFEVASLLGCGVITGVGAVFNRAKVTHGQSVLVIGVGGIGLNVIQGAALADALPIIAVDTNPRKEALARQFGATHFINAAEVDTVEAVKEICPNGVDVSFECVGHPALIRNAIDALDWGGTAVILGVPKFGTEASFLVSSHVQRQDDHGLPLRRRPAPQGHPAVRRPLPGRAAQARRAGHPHLRPGRHPADHRRHARGRPGPRRAADRLTVALPPELAELAASVSNWGRWGDDDERGTANLIDDAALRRGLDAVRTGRHVSLAIPLDQTQPAGGRRARSHRARCARCCRSTRPTPGQDGDAAFNDDTVVMAMSAGTHIDALGHVSYAGKLYNGFPAETATAVAGLTRCGAEKIGPIMSRGVLLDLPAALGVDRLEAGYAITADDLDRAVEHARVELAPGDVLCVRTGHMKCFHEGKTTDLQPRQPGPVDPHDRDGSATTTAARSSPTPTCTRCGRRRTGRR